MAGIVIGALLPSADPNTKRQLLNDLSPDVVGLLNDFGLSGLSPPVGGLLDTLGTDVKVKAKRQLLNDLLLDVLGLLNGLGSAVSQYRLEVFSIP